MPFLRNHFLMSVALVSVVSGAAANAQSSEGRISGVVRDASGAIIPGATVTVTNQTTNASQTLTASADGTYSAQVRPGTYSVTVVNKGFGRQTRKDVRVEVGTAVAADFS